MQPNSAGAIDDGTYVCGLCNLEGELKSDLMQKQFPMTVADLILPNTEAVALLADFTLLYKLARDCPGETPIKSRAMAVANEIINTFKQYGDSEETDASILECMKLTQQIFGEGWFDKGHKLFLEGTRKHSAVFALGNCHIDSAWLWPYSVTKQKVARSWTSQLDLMDRYPEYRFVASSAQQYKWLEENYPSTFKRVTEKIASGQFEVVGGTWVEMDTNLPSGESLCRQFMYGQRYFGKKFGVRCDNHWLPDSFGYCGQLPQICRLAGIRNFFTQKLSWSEFNKFPHSTFNWAGIDGSQVITQMSTTDRYDATFEVFELYDAVRHNKNLDVTDAALILYGFGDGKGGPTFQILDDIRRLRGASNEFSEIPQIVMDKSAKQVFDRIRHQSDNGKKLPLWSGGMYLEFHRGTYTSQSVIKAKNRQSEIMLQEAEYLATLADINRELPSYPNKTFDEAWECLLLNQFHDILPGSAIKLAYDEAKEVFDRLQYLCKEAYQSSWRTLEELISSTAGAAKSSKSLFAINFSSEPRHELVDMSAFSESDASSSSSKYTLFQDLHVTGVALPAPKSLGANRVSVSKTKSGDFVMESDSAVLVINKGRMTSLYDRIAERELIGDGQSAGLVVFEDQPRTFDAWNTEISGTEKGRRLTFDDGEILEDDPNRVTVKFFTKYMSSNISIEISLDSVGASTKCDSRGLLRFKVFVDWHEEHKFLKFELPTVIRSTNATYGCQFGVASYPTHRNTSWDAAQFEVVNHKFFDHSDYSSGVAILNKNKYGAATEGGTMRLSLLRSPTLPDPSSDRGENEIEFGIYLHGGPFLSSDVPTVARHYQAPLRVLQSSCSAQNLNRILASPFKILNAKNVAIETIKMSDVDSDAVIVRMYEGYGGSANVQLQCILPDVTSVQVVNLLEDHISDEKMNDQLIKLTFRAFEIKTLKISFKRRADGSAASSPLSVTEWVKLPEDE